MKITIFNKAKAKPEDKALEAAKCQYGETLEINSVVDFCNAIKYNAWSPSIFKDNMRLSKMFIQTDMLTLDIDDTLTLADTKALLEKTGYKCIIGTTISHAKEKNGVVKDRFRLIFPLERTITKIEDYYATWSKIYNLFPCDKSCRDVARFYFACEEVALFDGYRFIPVVEGFMQKPKNKDVKFEGEYGELSNRTKHFLLNGAKQGEWHSEFLYACRDMKAQGYNYKESEVMLSEVTGTLDERHDIPQLQYCYLNQDVVFDFRRKRGKIYG